MHFFFWSFVQKALFPRMDLVTVFRQERALQISCERGFLLSSFNSGFTQKNLIQFQTLDYKSV